MLDWLEAHPNLREILVFIGGIIATLFSSYFKFSSELSFIKGQLGVIVKNNEKIDELIEANARMELNASKFAKDLDKTYARMKTIETALINRGVNN